MYISTLAEKKNSQTCQLYRFLEITRSIMIPIDCIENFWKNCNFDYLALLWFIFTIQLWLIFLSVFTIIIMAFKNLLQEHFLLNFSRRWGYENMCARTRTLPTTLSVYVHWSVIWLKLHLISFQHIQWW